MEEILADSRKHARSTAGLQFVLISSHISRQKFQFTVTLRYCLYLQLERGSDEEAARIVVVVFDLVNRTSVALHLRTKTMTERGTSKRCLGQNHLRMVNQKFVKIRAYFTQRNKKEIVIAHFLYSLVNNLNYVCSTAVYFAASFAAAESICFVIVLTIR